MATDNRFGLQPYDSGGDNVATSYPYFVTDSYATALYVGDPVTNQGGANTVATGLTNQRQPGSLQIIEKSGTVSSARITGSIIGWEWIDATGNLIPSFFRPASVNAVAMVCDDPNYLYRIQANGVITNSDIGKNANLIYDHAGSPITGLSGAELDSSSISVGSTKQLTIVGIVPGSGSNNDLGTNTEVIVRINLAQPFPGIAGVPAP